MSKPVLPLYLRVPAPNFALHGILIGVNRSTHDQLTGRDTDAQGETPAQPAQRPVAPQ